MTSILGSVEFWAWLILVSTILGVGATAMINAYARPEMGMVAFSEAIAESSTPLNADAIAWFEQGCNAHSRGSYREAGDLFSRVIQQETTCAEAFHNRGLAQANLGNYNLAVSDLLKASELYDRQGTKAGIERVKKDLEVLAQR
ncbi:MAG: hypothetical protein HC886_15945 [Leptolyngbyaceae cyanobacterium SM1_1_3]|nr:hypothetical protein [Leptolyngbyaceae cyanobacterium SM1_1_3]NJN04177.1 hypothetical protein [Leptolyngbyaceae cyanobacterium RM1_1_2]NJO08614.1 hypothetical protein [Leptolyngbyaceae cyanobacterium SL_1_1]